jgi:hypothetical protein
MKLYSTREAAGYLGCGVQNVKYHYYSGNLEGQVVGKTMVFTQGQLDAFVAKNRRPGRPRKMGKEVSK